MEINRSATNLNMPQNYVRGFGSDTLTSCQSDTRSPHGQDGGAINFGSSRSGVLTLNFFNMPSEKRASASDDLSENLQGQGGGSDNLSQQLSELLNLLMKTISQLLHQSAGGRSGSGSPSPHTSAVPGQLAEASSMPPVAIPNQSATPTSDASSACNTNAPSQVSSDSHATSGATSNSEPGSGPTAGSGPRTFNITNTQDHDIKLGQFDKDNKLVAEMTLKPGETGQMKYQNDFTGLVKQADADGKYQDNASRLEFYNGFVNTSDIDGRNASIHATDHKGFEIGDEKSIADKAPDSIVTKDSAGNKTIAGWYDGSTDKMREGGKFMTDQLGTGMTYMHPDDDKLPKGQNPMRSTDSMTLDVTFGKA